MSAPQTQASRKMDETKPVHTRSCDWSQNQPTDRLCLLDIVELAIPTMRTRSSSARLANSLIQNAEYHRYTAANDAQNKMRTTFTMFAELALDDVCLSRYRMPASSL